MPPSPVSPSRLPVARRWFSRTRIDDTTTLITEPHVHEMLRCNIWHIRGSERDMLVDTGLGISSLAAATGDLRGPGTLAVATHAHVDHVGSLHEFDHRAIHKSEATSIVDISGTLRLDITRADPTELGLIAQWGYDISGGLLDAIPDDTFELDGTVRHPTIATVLLSDGDVIDLGDRAFEVLHLPGHSPGSIGLWDPVAHTLFSGDAVYDGPLLDEIDGANIADYLDTMTKLRRLPIHTAHGGHGPSMNNRRFNEIIDTYLNHRQAMRSNT